jgi:hypothetical protein
VGFEEGCKLEVMSTVTTFSSSEATNVVGSQLVEGPSAVEVDGKCGPVTETMSQLTYFGRLECV